MTWQQLLVELFSAGVWPIVVVFALIMFRKDFRRVRKFKALGVSLLLDEVEQGLRHRELAAVRPLPGPTAILPKMQEAVDRLKSELGANGGSTSLDALAEARMAQGQLSRLDYSLVMRMASILHLAETDPGSLTKAQVKQFVRLVDELANEMSADQPS